MNKARCLGLLAAFVVAVAQDASWWQAVGGGSNELGSEPQDASLPTLSGALNDLISRETSHRRQLDEAQVTHKKLSVRTHALQKREQSSEEAAARFTKMATLARSAEEIARASYGQRLKSVVQEYESEAHIMSQTVEKFREQQAAANRTATLAERELHQQRRYRHAIATYARKVRSKLTKTGRELQAAKGLLHKLRWAASLKEAKLKVKIERAEKADAAFKSELDDVRKGFENRSQELLRLQTNAMAFANRTVAIQGALSAEQLRTAKAQGFGNETSRELNMLRAAVEENRTATEHKLRTLRQESKALRAAAERNASDASIALHAAEEVHEVLSVHSESLLNHARAAAAASSEKADEEEREVASAKAELNSVRASLRSAQEDSQHRALELHEAKARLAGDDHVLNATERELSAAAALVHQQDKVGESMAEANAKLKVQEDEGLSAARAQIAKDKVEREDLRQRLSARAQEANASHHDLEAALDLIRDEQDFHAKAMKTVARIKRDDAQKGRVYSSEIASLNAKLKVVRDRVSTKGRELSLTREAWREANASLAGATEQLSLVKTKLHEQAAQASANLTHVTESLKMVDASLIVAEHEVHDKDIWLGKAHAEIGKYDEQLRESASELARQTSAHAALGVHVLKLENQTVRDRAQAHVEHDITVAAVAAKDQTLSATRHELAQTQAQMKVLHTQGIALQAELQAKQEEASQLQKELWQAEASSAQERSARNLFKEELSLALAELRQLNATHLELATEFGVTFQNIEAGAAKEVLEAHQMRQNLGLFKEELNQDRKVMGLRDTELNQTQVEVEAMLHSTSIPGVLRAYLSEAGEMLGKFHQELAARNSSLNQANVSLTDVLASVSALHQVRSRLDWTSKELGNLGLALGRRGQELNATRAQQAGAIRSLNQLAKTQAAVTSKLTETTKNMSLTRAELAAKDGELNSMNKELAKTMEAVKDFKDMDVKFGATQKELNAYQDALTARTSQLSAMQGEVAAARNLRSATGATVAAKIKDAEQMKAKLLADGVQLISLRTTIEKTDSEFRSTNADTVRTRRLGVHR